MKMSKRSRGRWVLLTGLLFFLAVPKSFAVEGKLEELISRELAKTCELEVVWQNELPMGKAEALERLFVIGNRVYALSSSNYMVSLDRETGKVVFSIQVARAGLPAIGFELCNDELFSVIGNRIVEINPESGAERSVKGLKVGVICPAVRNSTYFYVAGADKRVHAFRAEDKVQVFEAAAQNASGITSVLADERFVIFTTDAGNVISIRPDKAELLWQFDARGGIVAPIVKDGDSLFVASGDTNIYKLDIVTGRFDWKYQAQEVLTRGPQVTGEIVYQSVDNKGLTAIDKKSGKALWHLAEGVDLLAQGGKRTYVITNSGELAVMDNQKAKRVCTINLAGVSRYATNVADSKIYIADKSGRVACLQPVQ
jgi:outer membrane protein assembly factor BamB